MYRTFPDRGRGDKKQSALCKVSLGDRSLKHFFVAENYDRIETDKELKAFLKMLMTGRTEDSYTRELELCTAKAKQNAQTRKPNIKPS